MPKPAEPRLSEIQAWLHTFVVAPGDQDQALASAEERAGFPRGSDEDLILPSPTLSPRERIQIYRGMYLLRMQEALEIDFPAVKWRLGPLSFKRLVAEYVGSHPSQSYTLDHLGRNFAHFIRDTDWDGQGEPLAELAALEWSLCEVAVAHDAPSLGMTDLQTVPEERFLDLKFKPVHALRLHDFAHDVNSVYKQWLDEEQPGGFSPTPIHLVVWRHELKVWRMELAAPARRFLQSLCQGRTLGAAIDLTLESQAEDEERLFGWFQEWITEGFFTTFTLERKAHE